MRPLHGRSSASYAGHIVSGGLDVPHAVPELGSAAPGPVESGLPRPSWPDLSAAESQPGLWPRSRWRSPKVLDGPDSDADKPSAARQLVRVLDELHKASARTRRGGLALVKAMTEKGG